MDTPREPAREAGELPEPAPARPLVVPRQRRRDAYTLYAEIYALQRDLKRTERR